MEHFPQLVQLCPSFLYSLPNLLRINFGVVVIMEHTLEIDCASKVVFYFAICYCYKNKS